MIAERIQKPEVIQRLAKRMETNTAKASVWLDAVQDVLYEAFQKDESVTLPGLGGFYLKRKRDGCVFKFNPGQKLRALFGWSSTYKGEP